MSASHAPALDAIAFQLAAALEAYEQHVAVLVETWLDMDLYRQVSDEIEQIRMFSAALPQMGAAWVELLIAHAELVHSLWRLRFREHAGERERFEDVRARHAVAITALKVPCVRLLARQGQSLGGAPVRTSVS